MYHTINNVNNNMKLFTITHKPIENTEGWDILQVGQGPTFSDYRDNTDDNISGLNHLYLETTGIYWVWKNISDPIKGVQQYRRRLNYSMKEISIILKWYDIIVARPLKINPYEQYRLSHHGNDLLQCRELVPSRSDFDNYIMNGNRLYYANSFIAKESIFNDACKFCFDVLDRFVEQNNFNDYDTLLTHATSIVWGRNPHPEISEAEYQARICGALFERLLTLYLCSHKLRVFDYRAYRVLQY